MPPPGRLSGECSAAGGGGHSGVSFAPRRLRCQAIHLIGFLSIFNVGNESPEVISLRIDASPTVSVKKKIDNSNSASLSLTHIPVIEIEVTKLIDIKSASEWLSVSRDQIMAFIDDGDIEYVDVARHGSSHREIRFTTDMIVGFINSRSRRNAKQISSNHTKVVVRGSAAATLSGISASGSVARFRASIEG